MGRLSSPQVVLAPRKIKALLKTGGGPPTSAFGGLRKGSPGTVAKFNNRSIRRAEIRSTLEAYGGAALKRLGQNFLIDDALAVEIAAVAGAFKRDIIVEVGPGLGALTQKLLMLNRPLIAIEKDALAVRVLKRRFEHGANIAFKTADVLKIPQNALPLKPYTLVANLPYNITTPFLERVLNKWVRRPAELIVLLQKEAAERILAPAPQMNPLAFLAADRSTAIIYKIVGPHVFWPHPRVHSALVIFKNIGRPTNAHAHKLQQARFSKITQAFTFPRKTLLGITNRIFKTTPRADWAKSLKKAGLGPQARPSQLSPAEWRAWLKATL